MQAGLLVVVSGTAATGRGCSPYVTPRDFDSESISEQMQFTYAVVVLWLTRSHLN
jgi:hypothetical protein